MSLLGELIACGADLLSEDGENPEYDRAIAEFVIDMAGIGLSMDDKPVVMDALRTHKELTR